jgi:choline dehydrogenase-like flavoprotein
MLFDFNEAWPRVIGIQYDVCICGTGPAGITTARRLAARGKKVVLLEAGGLTYSDESQSHYNGKNVGRTYWLETSRLRYLGGSSNHWAGLCVIQEPITFEAQHDAELPGWPISYEQVYDDIDEAKKILDIEGKDLSRSKRRDFASNLFDQAGIALSPPTLFFEKYGTELRQSQQIDVFYNANLFDLTLNDSLKRVTSFRVQNYKGQIAEVSSSHYILALGGIENVRILLNANRQVAAGIGNHSGMVGRCFMEGLNVPIGRFVVTDPEFWQADSPALCPSEALMRRNNIGNGIISFYPNISAGFALAAYGRLRVIKEFIHETGCSLPALTALARQIVDFNCPGDGVISSTIEQEPNRASCVSLTKDVDSFGLRRVEMNWQLSDGDLKTIRVLSIEVAKEMARLNRARVQLASYILDPNLDIQVSGFGHHMGTTRMSADPRYGVVDENCRVHGIQNLYVAGSSVFPRCGGRNPTLTVVSLAVRLGDFISKSN